MQDEQGYIETTNPHSQPLRWCRWRISHDISSDRCMNDPFVAPQVYAHYRPVARRAPPLARRGSERGLTVSTGDVADEAGNVFVRERLSITCRLVKDFQQEIQLFARSVGAAFRERPAGACMRASPINQDYFLFAYLSYIDVSLGIRCADCAREMFVRVKFQPQWASEEAPPLVLGIPSQPSVELLLHNTPYRVSHLHHCRCLSDHRLSFMNAPAHSHTLPQIF